MRKQVWSIWKDFALSLQLFTKFKPSNNKKKLISFKKIGNTSGC